MSNNIKKYPIFYQGKEYEIRIEEVWYKDTWGKLSML